MANIVVKVGRTSNLQLRNVRAMRAVTFDDVKTMLDKYSEISAVIIDGIVKGEEDEAITTISSLQSKGVSVFLYNEAEDDEMVKIGDKANIDVAKSLDELQHNISKEIAIKVYTAWCREIDIKIGLDEDGNTNVEVKGNNTVYRSTLSEALSAFDASKANKAYKHKISNKDKLLELIGESGETLVFGDTLQNILENDKKKQYNDLVALLEEVTREKDSYKERLSNTEDKLERLIDIRNTLESEKSVLEDKVKSLSIDANIENPVPGKLLDEAKEQIDSLKSNVMELEKRAVSSETEKDSIKEEMDAIKSEHNTEKGRLEGRIEQLSKELKLKDESISLLEGNIKQLDASRIELLNMKNEKITLENKIVVLENKIEQLNANISAESESSDADMERIKALRNEIDTLNKEVSSLNEEIKLRDADRIVVIGLLDGVVGKVRNGIEKLSEKNYEIERLSASKNNLEALVSSNQEKIKQLNDKISELESKSIEDKENNNIEIISIRNEFSDKISQLTIQRDTKERENLRIRAELNELQVKLDAKDTELAKMLVAQSDVERDSKNILASKGALEKTNRELQDRVDALTREVLSLTSKVSLTEDYVASLEKKNKKLQSISKVAEPQVAAVNRKVYETFKLKLRCNYSGTATIIPVMGSGSYGVTTVAMALARRIPRAKILYMDLNTISPKADGWFKKSPIINSLTDIPDAYKRTAFGALIEKGSKYIINNLGTVIQQGNESQIGSQVDYFSGVYTKVDNVKLNQVDFSDLFVHLGGMYNYIVMDMGIIGTSDTSDELIKMVCGMANKYIMVTLNDGCDIRSAHVRASYNGLDIKKAIWVLNLAENTNISNMLRKIDQTIQPIVIPKDNEVRLNTPLSGRNIIMRDRITEIADLVMR